MMVLGLVMACYMNARLALVFAVCMPVLAAISDCDYQQSGADVRQAAEGG